MQFEKRVRVLECIGWCLVLFGILGLGVEVLAQVGFQVTDKPTTYTFMEWKGKYYVADDASPVPKFTEVTLRIVKYGDGAPEPPPVPDTTLTEKGKAVKALVGKVADPQRVQTAKALATVYSDVAKKLRIGEFTAATALPALRADSDTALGTKGAAWKAVRDLISEYWAAIAQEGGTEEAYAEMLEEVSAGLVG